MAWLEARTGHQVTIYGIVIASRYILYVARTEHGRSKNCAGVYYLVVKILCNITKESTCMLVNGNSP